MDDARGGGDAGIGIAPPANRAKPDGDASALEKTATTRRGSFTALADYNYSWIGGHSKTTTCTRRRGTLIVERVRSLFVAVAGRTGNLRAHAKRKSFVFLLVSRARSTSTSPLPQPAPGAPLPARRLPHSSGTPAGCTTTARSSTVRYPRTLACRSTLSGQPTWPSGILQECARPRWHRGRPP